MLKLFPIQLIFDLQCNRLINQAFPNTLSLRHGKLKKFKPSAHSWPAMKTVKQIFIQGHLYTGTMGAQQQRLQFEQERIKVQRWQHQSCAGAPTGRQNRANLKAGHWPNATNAFTLENCCRRARIEVLTYTLSLSLSLS